MARYEFATHRLFVEHPLASGGTLPLDPAQFNYLAHVLRMPEGGRLLTFNGRDGEFEATFSFTGKKSAAIRILGQTRAQERAGKIHLAFAPLKSARLEYMIQKAVEMGAASLTPVLTRRTQTRGLRADKIRAHVIEAAEQCGVLALPEIHEEQTLERFLGALPTDHALAFCDEDATVGDPVTVLRTAAPREVVTLLIGPEGGFDEAERQRLLAFPHVIRLSLGPRILRADTAAVAGLAALQIALGDWR